MSDVVEVPGNTTTVTVTGTDPYEVTVSQERGPQGIPGDGESGRAVRSDTDGAYTYVGVAPADSAESAQVWTITRILQSDDGTVSTAVAAAVAWDDRLTAAYA